MQQACGFSGSVVPNVELDIVLACDIRVQHKEDRSGCWVGDFAGHRQVSARHTAGHHGQQQEVNRWHMRLLLVRGDCRKLLKQGTLGLTLGILTPLEFADLKQPALMVDGTIRSNLAMLLHQYPDPLP